MFKNLKQCKLLVMSRFKIVNLIDKVFVSCAIFLIIFAWLNFYVRNISLTFFLSLVFSSAICYILFYFYHNKQNKISLTKKEAEEIDLNFLAFSLLSTKEKLNLIKTILEKTTATSIIKNVIYFENEGKQTALIVATEFEKLSNHNLVNMLCNLPKEKLNEIQLIINNAEPNLNLKILKNCNIKLITKFDLYNNFFKANNVYPEKENLNTNVTKQTWQNLLKNLFLPQKAKPYFLCGFVLILSSIILPFHVYYLIAGTILLFFSILCKIRTKI